jgi:hypothetical protein
MTFLEEFELMRGEKIVDATEGRYGSSPMFYAISTNRKLNSHLRDFLSAVASRATGTREHCNFPPVKLAFIAEFIHRPLNETISMGLQLQKRGYVMMQGDLVFLGQKIFEDYREILANGLQIEEF